MAEGEKTVDKVDEKPLYPTYTDHNGYLMPKGFPIAGFESGLRYKATEKDLFVATYPKCGTTWCQFIVYLILNNGAPLPPATMLEEVFPHLEEVGAEPIEKLPIYDDRYRLIKTHLHFHMTPWNSKAKYIYVARNPKDCCVSFYYHTKGFTKHYNFGEGTFDAYLELFLKGQVDFGDYFENVLSWYSHRSDENVLFLTYEELKSNARDCVLRIASFLGEQYRSRLLANNESILQNVLEHSSFGGMQKDQGRWSSERPKEHTGFVRKGSIGNWKNHLTPSQSEEMNSIILSRMSREQLADIWGPQFEEIVL